MVFKKISSIKQLQMMADIVREDIITSLLHAKSGHSAGPLGMADIMTALYFNILKHNPKKPKDPKRDRFILSNGHTCPVLYSVMANAGYFPKKELLTLRKLGSRLQGHPHRTSLPGLETTSGPLGSGLSQAAGMALVMQREKKSKSSSIPKVFVYAGDGEQNEGNHWEAVMFAAKEKLSNLICITDRNFIQIDGNTEDVMPLGNLENRYKAFGWDAVTIIGNDMKQILASLNKAYVHHKKSSKPLAIIALTVPGKGVDFMENDHTWHGKAPKKGEAKLAIEELHEHEAMLRGNWYNTHNKKNKPIHTHKKRKIKNNKKTKLNSKRSKK